MHQLRLLQMRVDRGFYLADIAWNATSVSHYVKGTFGAEFTNETRSVRGWTIFEEQSSRDWGISLGR